MKKIISITLILMLTLIVAACGGGSSNTPAPGNPPNQQSTTPANPSGSKVADNFFNMFGSGNYHMKALIVADGVEVETEQYFKNGMMAVIIEIDGTSMRTVTINDKMYMIDDETKTVMVMPVAMGATGGETPAIDTDGMVYSTSGTGEFHGKNLPYDEYTVRVGGKAQFFVDGSKLAGIRSIDRGTQADIVILEFGQNVPDRMFEIPANYTKMEF
jgi:hypothetical protein